MANEPTPADGTVSVLSKDQAPAVTAAEPCTELRGVRLSDRQVRRLNRIADRQEARDERNCRCDCADPKVLVAKPNKCNCNCR
jgi:hypothetical protein